MSHKFERGQVFEEHGDEIVDEVIVLECGNIGYDGYRLAEQRADGDWSAYWMKAKHLHDEVHLDIKQPSDELPETGVSSLQSRVRADFHGTATEAAEGVVASAD